MPIEILGRSFLSEAEFAAQLGCAPITLHRMRKAGRISYQKLPGRRGAFYGAEHVDAYLAALSVPAQSARPPDAAAIEEPKSALVGPRAAVRSSQVGLSDIQRASQLLSRRSQR